MGKLVKSFTFSENEADKKTNPFYENKDPEFGSRIYIESSNHPDQQLTASLFFNVCDAFKGM